MKGNNSQEHSAPPGSNTLEERKGDRGQENRRKRGTESREKPGAGACLYKQRGTLRKTAK
jgi:hypothetical protein